MKKLYIVCVLTVVMFVEVVLFHSRSANAQSGIRVDRIVFQGDTKAITIPQATGRVVGFSCSHFGEGPSGDCFIATSPN